MSKPWIISALLMEHLYINYFSLILFLAFLIIGIVSLIFSKKKILAKSIFCTFPICGLLILLNFICPFLSIKTNYNSDNSGCHGIFLPGHYEDETIDIGLFGINTINITSGEYEVTNHNNRITEHHSTKKYLNTVVTAIDFIIIFIILFIRFYKQNKQPMSMLVEEDS